MWGWLDPVTPIRALERLRERRPEARLVFAGIGAGGGEEAMAFARDRGLEGEAVAFVPGRLDQRAYVDHLLEGHAGVSAHPDTLEARFATRTRILDYLWAGLPVACTRGDTLGDFVARNGLGAVADPGDVDGFAAALEDVLFAEPRHRRDRAALEPLLWRNVARPLVEYCREPDALPPRPRRRAAACALRAYGSFLESVYRGEGPRGVARAAARRVRRG